MKKIVAIIVILVLLAGGGYYVYHLKTTKAKKVQTTLANTSRLYEVSTGSLVKTISANGTVAPIRERDLSFMGNGLVKQLKMKEGTRVKDGELLASLESTQQKLNMIKAQNDLEMAKITGTKADQAEKQLSYELAKKDFEDMTLYAPFDGLITAVNIEKDDTIGSGNNAKVAGHIIDDSRFIINLSIDEVDISQIKIGQSVQVSLEAYPNDRFKGKVTKIGLTAVTDSGVKTIPVEVSLSKSDVAIKPGLSATAEIVVAEAQDVIVVPMTAVIQRRNQTMVMKKDEEGKIVSTPVTTGISNDIMYEITEGLSEGDQIVVNNSDMMQQIRNRTQNQNSNQNRMNNIMGGQFGGQMGGNNNRNRNGGGNK